MTCSSTSYYGIHGQNMSGDSLSPPMTDGKFCLDMPRLTPNYYLVLEILFSVEHSALHPWVRTFCLA